ncbi:hypothetical protein ANDO1_1727 [plant metagenome]|uniref:Uncharacterized protein n=1 Tax=plant metagenome TaxID=1297885 RepID=A0A484P670_9ZZZZ
MRDFVAFITDRDSWVAVLAIACAVQGYSIVQQRDEAAAFRMEQEAEQSRHRTATAGDSHAT